MSTILLSQFVTTSGEIGLAFSSSDIANSGLTFNLQLNYTGASVQFEKATFSGTSSATINSNYAGSFGSVTIASSLIPASTAPFATLYFSGNGKGTFNADIVSFKINGITPTYIDPPAYDFIIRGESAEILSGASAAGTYQPLDGFFKVLYTVKTEAQHGAVVFGQAGNESAWKYTAAPGFYGLDTFTLKVADAFDSKEKTISVNVSPVGTAGNDNFHSSAATYHTDGGAGVDTIAYSGKAANFSVVKSASGFVVTDKSGNEGINYLDNFERLKFSDSAIALDIAGNGGQAYRIYQAAFNRTPDAIGLGFWINALDKKVSLVDVAAGFMNSLEFKAIYGNAPSNSQLVTKFYENILHRAPEKGGYDFWLGVLDTHSASAAEVLAAMSESAENQAGLAAVIGQGFAYTPFAG